MEGHYIIPVNTVKNIVNAGMILDENNIVFLSKSDHIWVHKVGDTPNGIHQRVVELVPWIKDKVIPLLQ